MNFFTTLLSLYFASRTSAGAIPDAPNSFCSLDGPVLALKKRVYNYNSNTQRYNAEDYDYKMAVIDSTWIFYDSTEDTPTDTSDTNAVAYCSQLPSDYSPNGTNPGDARDCVQWSPDEEMTVVEFSECRALDTELIWLDWIYVAYAGLVVIVLSLFVCPFCPYHIWCQKDTYPAASLQVYDNILELQGLCFYVVL